MLTYQGSEWISFKECRNDLIISIQATSGSGGWPMSVWLTPDKRPIVGGTYFPPDDRYYGRPGFKSVLLNISQQVSRVVTMLTNLARLTVFIGQ